MNPTRTFWIALTIALWSTSFALGQQDGPETVNVETATKNLFRVFEATLERNAEFSELGKSPENRKKIGAELESTSQDKDSQELYFDKLIEFYGVTEHDGLEFLNSSTVQQYLDNIGDDKESDEKILKNLYTLAATNPDSVEGKDAILTLNIALTFSPEALNTHENAVAVLSDPRIQSPGWPWCIIISPNNWGNSSDINSLFADVPDWNVIQEALLESAESSQEENN